MINRKDLDINKITGNYIHFGKVIQDLQDSGGLSLLEFYNELVIIQNGILVEFLNDPEMFKQLKNTIIKILSGILTNLYELKIEDLIKIFDQIGKDNPDIFKEILKKFGKNDLDYFG